jgi:hypothetical protein
MTLYQIISLFLALLIGGWYGFTSLSILFLKKGEVYFLSHFVTCLLVVNLIFSFVGLK